MNGDEPADCWISFSQMLKYCKRYVNNEDLCVKAINVKLFSIHDI